jgi:FkbM family methyltransferase
VLRAKQRVRKLVRSFGYDLVRFPRESLGGHLATLIDRLGVDCVLDVGARYGEYAETLRGLGYTGRLVSFEPVAEHFEILERAARTDPEWHVRRLALGSETATRTINVTRGSHFTSFLTASEFGRETFPETEVEHEEQVEVRRLDDLFAEVVPGDEPRVFLKLDTQGWDLEVLRGAPRSLDAVVAVQSEISVKPVYDGMPSYLEVIPYLNERGFELSGLFPVGRDERLRVLELDCVLVRADRVTPGAAQW